MDSVSPANVLNVLKRKRRFEVMSVQTKVLDTIYDYNGQALAPRHNYLNYGLLGDSILGFVGACDVDLKFMADGEDVRDGKTIAADRMAHLLVEVFDVDLLGAASLQRLTAELCVDVLSDLSDQSELVHQLRRTGDDLYCGSKKFNISVAVPSVNSCLIHFAVNTDNAGAPVETIGLVDFQVSDSQFLDELVRRLAAEIESIRRATYKVLPH